MAEPAAAIVIPAFNEALTIERVVQSVIPYGLPIVVDDHSSDDTASLAEKAGAIVVRNAVNLGYDGALDCGFRKAFELNAGCIVTFDADGQHEADFIGRFIELIENDKTDLVLGQRPKPARFSEFIFNLYTKSRFGVGDILCGFKAYRLELYRDHGCFDRHQSIGTELALASIKNGARVQMISVPIHDRQDQPRFGSVVRANIRILRAVVVAIKADIWGW